MAETGVFPASPGTIGALSLRGALQAKAGALMELGGLVKANSTRSFKFHGQLAPGRYVFAALMTATTNPGRTKLLVSTPFTIR